MLMDSSTRSPIFAFARLMQKRAPHCVRRPATLPPPLGIHILKLIAYDLFKSMISFYFSQQSLFDEYEMIVNVPAC